MYDRIGKATPNETNARKIQMIGIPRWLASKDVLGRHHDRNCDQHNHVKSYLERKGPFSFCTAQMGRCWCFLKNHIVKRRCSKGLYRVIVDRNAALRKDPQLQLYSSSTNKLVFWNLFQLPFSNSRLYYELGWKNWYFSN